MPTFNLEIKADTSAFDNGYLSEEISRILENLAHWAAWQLIRELLAGVTCNDHSGCGVGRWVYAP